jgi:ABC-type molybdate transport system permease subunit
MNSTLLGFGVFLLLVGVIGIATSSIGINCYNSCSAEKQKSKNNFNFLVINLIASILLLLGSLAFLYQLVALNNKYGSLVSL